MISVFQNSENSGYEYQVAPDMAMTVRMIMILLYGAGGVPGSSLEKYHYLSDCHRHARGNLTLIPGVLAVLRLQKLWRTR